MPYRRENIESPEFCVRNPNKAWVSEEIDNLIAEWTEWNEVCANLAEGEDGADYNSSTSSEAIKDGFSQGATVDNTFVLSSGKMDHHLTYVAMSRHRDSAKLYVDESATQSLTHENLPVPITTRTLRRSWTR